MFGWYLPLFDFFKKIVHLDYNLEDKPSYTMNEVLERLRVERERYAALPLWKKWIHDTYWAAKRFDLLWELKKAIYYPWQRLTRGYADNEIWSLDYTISKFVLPRLKALRENTHGYPSNACGNCGGGPERVDHQDWCKSHMARSEYGFATFEDWLAAIDDMIYFHECVIGEVAEGKENIDQERKLRGRKYFGDYYEALWD